MNYILGLDISTTTIGISLFEDLGEKGNLIMLTHVSPIVKKNKNKTISKIEELIIKSEIFEEEFLPKLRGFTISKVIIEEPLLRSNNINTVATLLRFNTLISKIVYDELGVIPVYISSYDARANAFPELMEIRSINKKGEVIPEKKRGKTPTLFGGYPINVDKKEVILEKVKINEPNIKWLISDKGKNIGKYKKENYDLADAYTCVLGYMKMENFWK